MGDFNTTYMTSMNQSRPPNKEVIMTQKELVKEYLERYGSITTWQAFKDLYILDLQGAIRDLRRKGMDIQDRRLYKRNRFGKRISYKKYFIRNVCSFISFNPATQPKTKGLKWILTI